MRLPNGDRAVVDVRKVRDYCLSAEHPRGQHKARVFKRAWGGQQLMLRGYTGDSWKRFGRKKPFFSEQMNTDNGMR